MKQTIDRLIEGKFEYERGSVEFSCSRIELTLPMNAEYTGSFSVLSTPGKRTEGYLFSNDPRMRLFTDSFSGTGEEIGYAFSTKGLEEGSVVKGEIQVISNQGEYYLPYVVTIDHKELESSLGNIKNLFHFANLAKTNWEEAVTMFYSEDFVRLFTGNDVKYLKVYKGLSAYYKNEQNVEEFLLQLNKKQPTEYLPEKEIIVIEEPDRVVSEFIDITKNGWGYTSLSVVCNEEFITLAKNNITDNDFLGNYLRFEIVIDPSKLHEGNNFASIRFFNSFTSFEVQVKVLRNVIAKTEVSKKIEYQRALLELMHYYEAFRLKEMSTDTWIAETGKTVDRLISINPDEAVAKMFKAQLLVTQNRTNEAKWILDQMENSLENMREQYDVKWAYFLYLTTLVNPEDSYIEQITGEVWNIFNRNSSDWRVAWLLLYLSEEYAASSSKKWLFITNFLSMGCVSPVMYFEAANLLLINPAFLNKLETVEIRILLYMQKRKLFNRELARQTAYLAGSGKYVGKGIEEILINSYEKYESEETLTALVNLLISKERTDIDSHKWYKLALEKDTRITGIYEYFMRSMDIHAINDLPRMVYLYFSYQCELDWVHTAYLYARVIENREKLEDVFIAYKEKIDSFAMNQVVEGHINRDLAAIYRFVLNENVLSKELAEKLSVLIFTHHITVDSDKVSKVVVYQSKENSEEIYPIEDKECYLPLYNKDFVILFEDNFSNRYTRSVNYDIEKLMVTGKMANMLLKYVNDNLSYDVYALECSNEMAEITEESGERYRRVLDSEYIDEEYKSGIRSRLIQYYYDNDRIRELDELLLSIEPDRINTAERKNVIRCMVIRGMYDRAMSWVMEYGMESLEPKDIVKLCSNLISRSDFVPSKEITSITAQCFFKGKYDETILTYLCKHFIGMTKDMRKLFTASINFDIDIYSLCENILIQMLYTGYFVSERMDIFKKYLSLGGSSDVIKAFVAQSCFDFFVKEQLVESVIFDEVAKMWHRNEKLLTINRLAYVKFFSENKHLLNEEKRENVRRFLDILIAEGVYFSFFKEFIEPGMEEINRFTDKTFIEYKTDPGKRVMIHYIVERGEDSKGEYVTQEMPDMYGGVHTLPFVLFFGENLLYYITEEENGDEQLTESGSISKSDIGRNVATSRFDEINDIVIANTLQDYETCEDLLYEYHKREYIISKLFTIR